MKDSLCDEGLVTAIKDDKIYIEYNRVKTCISCIAQKTCNISKKDKLSIEINQLDEEYFVGDNVKIVQKNESGMVAIYLSFVIPLILLISSLLITQLIFNDEMIAASSSLFVLVVYFFCLYLRRTKLDRKFAIKIRHL